MLVNGVRYATTCGAIQKPRLSAPDLVVHWACLKLWEVGAVKFGWTTLNAQGQRCRCLNVSMQDGGGTTVGMVKTLAYAARAMTRRALRAIIP